VPTDPAAIGRSFPGTASSDGSRLLSEEGRAFLQDRVAFYGRLGFLISVGFYVVLHLSQVTLLGLPSAVWYDGDAMLHLASSAMLGGIWLACRGAPRPPRVLAAVDLLGSTMTCVTAAMLLMLPGAGSLHETRVLLVVTNAVIARAAVVPTPARWTLLVSCCAVLPAVILGAVHHASPLRHPRLAEGIFASFLMVMWCAVAVAIATVTARVIYGLRLEVREARQLGQYTLEERIGLGGMGEVYRARHALLRRPTAVKLLPPGRAGETALRRFEREVQLTASLTHPNTVSVYDYGRTPDGIFYYAMEYLDGLDLDRLVSEDGPQAPARVVHLLRQVCASLAEAHGVGLIHRDIKPANLILCMRGGVPDVVKVLDFGLVRELGADGDASLTTDGVITGTPLFLAPEAIRSPGAVDARSDLYALGGVAYYLLTGVHVFEGANVVEVCSHHLHTTPVPPSERRGAELPAALEALVLQCLEKESARRPASARALLEGLSEDLGAGEWSEEAALAWWSAWQARAAAAGPAPASTPRPGFTQALTVDVRDRERAPS
jgi:serine/threonine-protein kinase